nr:hypothetical protein [Tanacetum cinerariifolium]
MESIFATALSSVAPLPTPTPTMTPSIITTITTASHPLIPPTPIPIAADLSEMELKKILIEKMEGNKSIQQSDEQRNLYKALVDAYEADKTILDSYGETTILKRRREDDDDQEGPSAGSYRGSKRRREGGEPKSARASLEPATRSAGRSTIGSKSRQASASESAFTEELMQTTSQIEEPSHPVFESAAQGSAQTWISELAKQDDSRSSFNELLDTSIDFSNFIMNRLGVDTLTPELLARPTYELMRGSCNSLIELEYHLEEVYKATTDQLDWVNPEGQQYPHNLLQPLLLIPDNRGRRVIPFAHFINNDLEYLRGGTSSRKYTTSMTKTKATDYGYIKFVVNRESALDVYFKRRIIAVIDLKIVEWHNYKHLDWILVRPDDDKDVYMEYHHPATCGRSSTLSRKLPEEAQPYQARHVPIRSEATRSIYCLFKPKRIHLSKQGQEKQGIRMQYLPQTIWRKGDKDKAAAMIQAVDKMLKTKRIMRSLERFVGGRLSMLTDLQETDTQEKDKNKAKNDKTKHGMEKILKDKVIRRQKSKVKARDEEGIDYLPNSTIFEQLALIGKPTRKDTQVPRPSGPTNNVADEAVHKELGDRLVRAATTDSSLGAEQDNGNITKTQSKATPNESSSQRTDLGGGPRCQETIGDTIAQTRFENVSKQSNNSLLARGNTLQSDEDQLKLDELMALCTNLQNKVLDLEMTKTTQFNKIASLKRRVKKLEKRNRSRAYRLKRLYKVGLSARVESSGDEESLGEDASKQGRRIDAIDADEEIILVNVHDDVVGNDADKEMFDVDVLGVSTTATTVTITTEEITLAQALEALKTSKPQGERDCFSRARKPTRKDTQVPQPTDPIEDVIDEAVDKELSDRLVRAATTASSLKAEQDSGAKKPWGDKDSLKLNELMALCIILQNKVLDLEKKMTTQRNEIASLKRRVKKLEKKYRSRTHRLKRLYKFSLTGRVESSGNEESLGEDASKHGSRIDAIDADEEITLVSVQEEVVSNDADKEMFDVDVLGGEEVFVAGKNENIIEEVVDASHVSTAATTITITTKEITLTQALETLKTSKPKVKGIVFQEPSISTTTIISSQQSHDKGKGIMIEEHVKPKKKDQIRLDEEANKKLQAEFNEDERLAREKAEKKERADIALIKK